jgi:hypothetical protein
VRTLYHQADSIRLIPEAHSEIIFHRLGPRFKSPLVADEPQPSWLQTQKHKHAPRLVCAFLSQNLQFAKLVRWWCASMRRCRSIKSMVAGKIHASIDRRHSAACTKMKRSFVTLGRSPLLLALNCDRRAQQAQQPPASRGTTIYTLTAARSHTCTQHLAKVSLVLRLGSRGEANKSGQTASYYSGRGVQLSSRLRRVYLLFGYLFFTSVCLSMDVRTFENESSTQSRSNVISKATSPVARI